MSKYGYSEAHIQKCSQIIQELLVLCRVGKVGVLHAETRQKQTVLVEDRQRYIPHMVVKGMLDKSGTLPVSGIFQASSNGWQDGFNTTVHHLKSVCLNMFKQPHSGSEHSVRANLSVTAAHKLILGLVHPLDVVCRDLHSIFLGYEMSLGPVIEEIIYAVKSSIKCPTSETPTHNSKR